MFSREKAKRKKIMFGCEEKLNVLEKAWSILFQNFFFFLFVGKIFPENFFLRKRKSILGVNKLN